jgi:tetratricopeptide (TPR) repeat protein
MLSPLLEDWRREPGVSVAADVVSAAFTIGCPNAAAEAARYLLEHKNAPEAARDIAQRCLANDVGPSQRFVEDYGQPAFMEIGNTIRQAKLRLIEYPVNPIRWTNLALSYTTLGQRDKALRSMQIALSLAPQSRFVIRAASRLFLHHTEIERAHSILVRNALLQHDPWILAGEIAVAAIRKRSSRYVKTARAMIESQNYSLFHLSELAAALATIEAHDGAVKKARRLCEFSLANPSENAVAQAAWLDRHLRLETPVLNRPTAAQSSEANAWLAFNQGDWAKALAEAEQWQTDQPFSSRPAIFGGSVASTAMEKFGDAELMLKCGLRSNSDDATLHNNLAFALANQGKVEEADQHVRQGLRLQPNPVQSVCLVATSGLILFRSGQPDAGRLLYCRAISMASMEALDLQRRIATIYLAIEELRARSDQAPQQEKQASETVEKLPNAVRSLFRNKLRRAKLQFENKSG